MAHLYISAAHKSSGKTIVATGLTAALVKRGQAVQAFKKGPDYIDPMWLARAAGRPCYNLDFFTQQRDEIIATFTSNLQAPAIGLIEGNKGLFDGLDLEGSDSNAALARMLGAPVVLVIDSAGMTRGIAPLLNGYLGFDPEVHIAGVILNRVGGARHESKLRAALEHYTDARVLGAIGRDPGLGIPERHLGLVPANEASGPLLADSVIGRLRDAVAAGTDLDRIIDIANSARLPALADDAVRPPARPAGDGRRLRIAVARDAAFGFYYPDDLEAFSRAGAELLPFDTLRDTRLPEADGLFIGGGFPETQARALSANHALLDDVRNAIESGMPAYAECGGLMYLTRGIEWRGETHPMAGVIPADTVVGDRPQGRGYMRLNETAHHPWPHLPGGSDPATAGVPLHEFHYARLENLSCDPVFTHRVLRGAGIDGKHDGLVMHKLVAGFGHHRHTAANPWVDRFVAYVRQNSHPKEV